ncbi:protein kinase [bacterium]|nr:protein kinase [bacterium]
MKFTYQPDARPVDGYTIRRGIHRGGFGEVYYAVSDAGKEVALKLLTHDLETELRGVRQCLNLKHPNLVTIFDVRNDADGDTWVIMEYVHGASLEDVLAAFPSGLPHEEVRDWMLGMFAGVAYLHDRGIVHRDLKPANVYRENGQVKIGDVGLSKQIGGGTRRQHTESVGTVYYMAPEVAKGQYGPEVDVYSLGVMLYELLTGRLPFDGETTAEILMKHLSAQPDLSDIPTSYRPLLIRALQKDPTKRIHSARQFEEELRRIAEYEPIPESAFEPPPVPSANPTPRSVPVVTAASTKVPVRPAMQTRPIDRGILGEVYQHVGPRFRRKLDRVFDRMDRHRERHLRPKPKPVPKPAPPPSVKTQAPKRTGVQAWWLWLPVVFLVFVPWNRMSQGDALELVGIIGPLSAVLIGLWYFSQPPSADLSLSHQIRGNPQVTLMEQIGTSWMMAQLAAVLLTLVAYVGLAQVRQRFGMWQLNELLWMAAISSLGSIAVVTVFQLARTPHGHAIPAPWLMVIAGLLVGWGCGQLGDFLEIRDGSPHRPLFLYIGPHALRDGAEPTVAAYMTFFAVALWFPNWMKDLEPQRPYRLRFSPILWSMGFALLIAPMIGIPREVATLWAGVVSASAQLAAPWQLPMSSRPVTVEAA